MRCPEVGSGQVGMVSADKPAKQSARDPPDRKKADPPGERKKVDKKPSRVKITPPPESDDPLCTEFHYPPTRLVDMIDPRPADDPKTKSDSCDSDGDVRYPPTSLTIGEHFEPSLTINLPPAAPEPEAATTSGISMVHQGKKVGEKLPVEQKEVLGRNDVVYEWNGAHVDENNVHKVGEFQRVPKTKTVPNTGRTYIDAVLNGVKVRSLYDSGAGPSLVDFEFVQKQGWQHLIERNADSMRPLKGFLDNIITEAEGHIEIQVKVGDRTHRATFIVCRDLAEELCILGQTVAGLFPYDYQWDSKLVVDREKKEALPCYSKIGRVAAINEDFDPRITPAKLTILRPGRGTFVKLDISRLPLHGAYILEADEVQRQMPMISVPRVLIQRRKLSDKIVKVPFLNFSPRRVAVRSNKYLMTATYVGLWHRESEFIKDSAMEIRPGSSGSDSPLDTPSDKPTPPKSDPESDFIFNIRRMAHDMTQQLTPLETPTGKTRPISPDEHRQQEESDKVGNIKMGKTAPKREELLPGIDLSNLDEEMGTQMAAALITVREVFAKGPEDVGTAPVYHRIDTGDTPPINLKVRRFNMKDKPLLKEKVEEMLRSDVIEPSNSPWSARALIVQKKDGTARFCVDYRALNAATKTDPFPLPNINDTLNDLSGSTLFTTVDLQSGFWQVQMAPEDRDKTGFTCEEGHFRYKKMPFGLKNAPSTFSRMMKIVLHDLLGPICLAFIDDVIIHSKTFDQHLIDVVKVLKRLDESGLKIKGKKCVFASKSIEFLGHNVSAEGISPSTKKVEAIVDMHPPKNLNEVMTVIGLFSYYRRFVENFGVIATPLYDLVNTMGGSKKTRSEKPVNLDEHPDCLNAFETLKKALTSKPVLTFPTLGRAFRIYCDASSVGMGSILTQIDDNGDEKVIEYASKKFTETERRYSTTERECYAVVWSLRHFRHIIAYDEIIVYTDHSALTAFANAKKETESKPITGVRFPRWMHEVDTYRVTLTYLPGKDMSHADALSRPPFIHSVQELEHDEDSIDPSDFDSFQETEDESDLLLQGDDDLDDVDPEAVAHGDVVVSRISRQNIIEAQGNEQFSKILIRYFLNRKARALGERPHYPPFSERAKALIPRDVSKWAIVDEDNGTDMPMLVHTNQKTSKWLEERMEVERPEHESTDRYKPSQLNRSNIQIYIPKNMRKDILDEVHASPYGGHLGREKIYSILQGRVYWPGMSTDVADFTRDCIVCRRSKHARANVAPMRNIYASLPFYRVGLDIMGPYPKTEQNNRYMFIYTCYFSKYPVVYCTENQTQKTLLRTYMKFCMDYGTPCLLQMDQGSQMKGKFLELAAKAMGTTLHFSTAYHSISLGGPERYNKTLGTMLRCFITPERQHDWDQYVDALVMAFRNAVHNTTGQTPQFMVFGHDMIMPFDLLLGSYVWDYTKPEDYVREKLVHLTEAWDHATRKDAPGKTDPEKVLRQAHHK